MTFSLVACDLEARQWGVAVASKFPSVGAVVPWAHGDVGAVATQSYANVLYGPQGLERLAAGESAQAVVDALIAADDQREDRQLGIVDTQGGSATFTGRDCMDWAGGRTGPGYAAQGNILAGPQVVDALADTFTTTGGSLGERLVAALLAADRAGGDRRGRQSAALVVRQTDAGYGGNNDMMLDVRVDDHTDPVPELIRILGIHILLFGKTAPDKFLPLEGELAVEVSATLERRGFGSLDEFAGVENVEERLWPDGSRIDPELLRLLRAQPAG
ncbi:MAG: hypothetical protein QOI17_1726 [Gaiellales bacterium]|jgi:uncharacterized Ntn-hydrolase superfamily protein|nr:hypothetical protein [Gaiellales bacterium]